MRFLDALLGRTRPGQPDLDVLTALFVESAHYGPARMPASCG